MRMGTSMCRHGLHPKNASEVVVNLPRPMALRAASEELSHL